MYLIYININRLIYTSGLIYSFYKFSYLNTPVNVLTFIGILWFGLIFEIEKYISKENFKYSFRKTFFGFLILISYFLLVSKVALFEKSIWISLLFFSCIINYIFFKRIIYRCHIFGALLPFFYYLMPYLAKALSIFTAELISLLLNSFGLFSRVILENIIAYNNKGIEVLSGCSGYDQIFFSLAILLILNFRYPFKKQKKIFYLIPLIIILSISVNLTRISILTLVVFLQNEQNILFKTFHDSYGSLLFSFLASYLTCLLYYKLHKFENKAFIR